MNHSDTKRMLAGGDWVLKRFLDGLPNMLSTGYNLMASLVAKHGHLLEKIKCTDPHIYVKILAQFERIQFIMMEGFQNQLIERQANEDTVHFMFDLVIDRATNIQQMFAQLQLSNLQISLPAELSAALDRRETSAATLRTPRDQLGDDSSKLLVDVRKWHTVKLPTD